MATDCPGYNPNSISRYIDKETNAKMMAAIKEAGFGYRSSRGKQLIINGRPYECVLFEILDSSHWPANGIKYRCSRKQADGTYHHVYWLENVRDYERGCGGLAAELILKHV
jgi:hypothetical protein